jgi:hypothetical protein
MVAIKSGGKQLTSCVLIPAMDLLAMNLQDRVLYRRVSCDSELSSICSGVPHHQCHTQDHEACLCMVH